MNSKRSALMTLYLCIIAVLVMVIVALAVTVDWDGVSFRNIRGRNLSPVMQEVVLPFRTDPTLYTQLDPAPKDYFDDALFLGNAVLEGLSMYDYDGLLGNADFAARDGVNLLNAAELLEELDDKSYGKIYIELGTSEMSYDLDQLEDYYEALVDTLMERYPDSIIYLMAVPPVSRYKSNNNTSYTKYLAAKFNEMIQDIALDKTVWYLDIYTALADDDGYLPSEVTVDGIHFTPGHYELWYDYLRYHYSDAPPGYGDEA